MTYLAFYRYSYTFSGFAGYGSTVNLYSAASFAVLGGTTVTNTGGSVIVGDVGSYPGAEGSLAAATVRGVNYGSSGVSATAQADLLRVYSDITARAFSPASTSIGSDLTSTMLSPGVYVSSGQYLTLSGTLVFDARGDLNAIFVLIAPGTGYLA